MPNLLPSLPEKYPLIVLRILMGIIFISHSSARFYYASIPDFGVFLNSQGFMIGLLLAWIITLGELISGSFLVLGFFIRYCVLFHATIITMGIIMVHLKQGWFVVGHGTGGVEYSLLILAVLAVLYSKANNIAKS